MRDRATRVFVSSFGLLPEADRLKLVEEIRDHSITWLDSTPLKDESLQQIFTKVELSEYAERFRKEWLGDLPGLFDELCGRFSSDDEVSLFTDFRDNLQIAQRYFRLEEQEEEFSALYAQLDLHIEDLEATRASPIGSTRSSPSFDGSSGASSAMASTIFDDVDD